MELRPYQVELLDRTLAAFKDGARAVCVVLATGGGKTVIGCEIMRRALAKQRRVLFLVHRVELVDQASARLADFGIPSGQIIAKRAEARDHPIQVASVQTLVRRDPVAADIVFIDEAHHAVATTYSTVLANYPKAWLIGLTATPARLDGKPLKPPFEKLVIGCETRTLCDEGHLILPRIFSHPNQPDLANVHTVAGDYNERELSERCNKSLLIGSIVEHWRQRAESVRTLCFAVDIEHSLSIVDAFVKAGVKAEHLDGRSSPIERATTLQRLRDGETRIVSNCALFGEGYDLPDLACVIAARPTKSLTLWRQQVGRCMRPAPGKTKAIVLDHAGNALEHGLPARFVPWTLEGKLKVEKEKLYRCKRCFCVFPPPYPCPECGYAPPVVAREGPAHVAGELKEFKEVIWSRKDWYAARVSEASKKRRKLGWARHAYFRKFKVWPRWLDVEKDRYKCPMHDPVESERGFRCPQCLRV